ncbi:MAG: DEAD/DEAH box helicase [Kiritimatiellae bacterium]|nr:DEAD/DEAH box helicase [Kiritimatiellia bacterium]
MANTVFDLLNRDLKRAISEIGYAEPTPIQREAIDPILSGKDLFGCAQTGTGKTAAFALPLLHRLAEKRLMVRAKKPFVLILAPTRELAAQIGENIQTYARYQRTPILTVFGGVNIRPQMDSLQRGVAVLVATPGRLLDLCAQQAVALDAIQAVVLDEADRMLDMGFLPDIRKILDRLPKKRQSLFFSATLTPEITELAEHFIRTTPVKIQIDPGRPTAERVAQRVLFVDKENKYALLKWVLDDPKCFRVIVFPRMKHNADRLSKQLYRDGFPSASLHGDKSQNARLRALEGFKEGKIQVLVATDIAARGIDVDDVTHVINYDLPDEAETYVHRIGRTARAGAEGEAISLVCAHDRDALRSIERFIGMSIPQHLDHPLHSESARTAMGANARRPAKQVGQGKNPSQKRQPPKVKAKQKVSKPFWKTVHTKNGRKS